MKCPHCNADTLVVSKKGNRRRRECFNEHRFSTFEVLAAKTEPEDDTAAIRAEKGTIANISIKFDRSYEYVRKIKKAQKDEEGVSEEVLSIRAASGTLKQIAEQFNRSIYYVWKKRKATA